MEKTQRTGREVQLPVRCAVSFFPLYPSLHLHREIPHGLDSFILFLTGGVNVSPQGEPGVIVSQHGGHGPDVHTALEGQGGGSVSEIMEPMCFGPVSFRIR